MKTGPVKIVVTIASAVLLQTSALAQEEVSRMGDGESPAEAAKGEGPAITVTADPQDKDEVILGSRIPRKQRVFFEGKATNTGTPGLVPQSGMDPAASVRTLRRETCVSDDSRVGPKAACLLVEAQKAMGKEQFGQADALLDHLATGMVFSPDERLAGAQWRYRLAQQRSDAAARESALEQMLATGSMPSEEALAVRRTLVSLALKSGDQALARDRLAELDRRGEADAQDLANLAILNRTLGPGNGRGEMRRAIAKRLADGQSVPAGWREFAQD